ncbi:MAG: helix-turn-helix domain-containing protein [Candidatus Rokuibacteriota bacterium]
MRSGATPDGDADPLAALERAASEATPSTLIRLLGDVERLKASLWQRLLLITATQLGPAPASPTEELRHLTPHQVGALLGLKATYVHELCRTGRITATKSGKYWMIPVAGLRQWLAYPNSDVDELGKHRVESSDSRGDMASTRLTGPVGGSRRSPMS